MQKTEDNFGMEIKKVCCVYLVNVEKKGGNFV